jgi:hypothetical protein
VQTTYCDVVGLGLRSGCLASTRAPARWRHGRYGHRASGRLARELESGGMSFGRGGRGGRSRYGFHLTGVTSNGAPFLELIYPATRCKPTWPVERIRPAATVCYLQRDVFIKRSALDWIPAIVHLRWPHCAFSRFRAMAAISAVLGSNPKRAKITSAPHGVSPSPDCRGSSP